MRRFFVPALLTLALAAPMLASPGGAARAQQPINPADFQSAITHPLFPLSSFSLKVFEGEDTDPDTGDTIETRLESKVLSQTGTVAGVTVTVLEERDYEDGELVEVALDYFAQHKDGSVYYFGERVDNYEDGQLKDHNGTWLAGESGAREGIIMSAQPKVGETFDQENAPGIAEDKSTVLALGESVTVPAGTYTGCMKTRDFNPLEPGVEEFKWYCPGIGLVKEQGEGSLNELISMTAAAAPTPAPTAIAPAPTPTVRAAVSAPQTGGGGAGDRSFPAYGWAVAVIIGAGLVALGVATRSKHRRQP